MTGFKEKLLNYNRFFFPKLTPRVLVSLLFLGAFIFYEFKDLNEVLKISIGPLREALHFSKLSQNVRIRKKFDLIYDYANFIKENTPSDSTILVPPQAYPWPMTGNILFYRYFLYPRRLINGELNDPGANFDEGVDYVLLAKGEFGIEGGTEYGWPKFDLDASRIIKIKEFGPDGKMVTEEIPGPFRKDDPAYSTGWGLIIVREESK